MALVFEWDLRKATINQRKHQISFDEAATVFSDPLAVIFSDEDHSDGEEREIIVGHSVLNRVLLVSFAELARDRIRVISARKLTRKEQREYEEEIG